jgi:hypothetical protein
MHAVKEGTPFIKWKNWQRITAILWRFVDTLRFLCNISDHDLKNGSKNKITQLEKWWHDERLTKVNAYRLLHKLEALQEHSESINLYQSVVLCE